MKVIWSPTALGQLDDIYDTIATERDIPTAELRQLVIRPYRVVYEPTETTCDILGVMRSSHLIGRASLGLG